MLHAGIDVSKAHMDLALLVPSLQRTLRFPLLEADLPVAAVNPQQAAAFRQASGKRNKSDRQDALLLAQLGRVYGDTLLRAKLPERTLRALKALVGYRDDLRRRIHAIERQQESALWMGQEEVLPFLEEELSGVRRLLEEVEGRIRELAAGGGAARRGDGGVLPAAAFAGEEEEAGLGGRAHKLLRRMMGVLREFYERQGRNIPSASLPAG